jgi:hypothetical protein
MASFLARISVAKIRFDRINHDATQIMSRKEKTLLDEGIDDTKVRVRLPTGVGRPHDADIAPCTHLMARSDRQRKSSPS